MKKLLGSIISVKTFGNSMYPLLHNGDVITIKKVAFKNLRVNDIVTIKKYNKLVTHRVIYLSSKYLITKGDNNGNADGKIYSRQIIGKVTRIIRNGTYVNPNDIYLLQSTYYFQEITKIKKAFEREKINYLFLKGLPLHLYFEKSHPRRLYADCDILVDRKDLKKAVRVFKRHGYSKMNKALSPIHKNLQDAEIQISLYKIVNKFIIEFDVHSAAIFTVNQLGNLHTLYSRSLIEKINRDFLNEKKYVEIHGEEYPILSKENLIIFLAHHLSRHSFKGAYRWYFLNLLCNYYINESIKDNNLQILQKKIQKYKMTNIFYGSITLLTKHFNTKIPEEFIEKLKPNTVAKLYINKKLQYINIFNDEGRIEAGINRFSNQFFLSPYPVRKFLVFLQPKVIFSILWVLYYKILLRSKRIISIVTRETSL